MEEAETRRLRDENQALRAELERLRQDNPHTAVAASETRLRRVVDSIDEAFVLVDAALCIRDMNRRAAELDGRPPAKLIGQPYFTVWRGARDIDLPTVLATVIRERRPAALRHSYTEHGATSWFDVRIFPSGDGAALFYRDATADRAAEQRLRNAESEARLAMESARLGRWTADRDTGTTSWDERCRELLGVSDDTPQSVAQFLNCVHPADRARVAEAIDDALSHERAEPMDIEYRVVRPVDGQVRWLGSVGRPQFVDGRCVHFAGVIRDVTERRDAGRRRDEVEARFRAIAEATPFLVFISDGAGLNTYTNPQFSAFTGLSPERLLGTGWLQVVHPEDRARAARIWQRCLRQRAIYEIEQRFRRADGLYRWFLCRGIPVQTSTAEGEVLMQWFGSCTDIEDLVRAREVLARDRDEQERLVAERTAALQQSLSRLREDDARLRALFEHSAECLFLLRAGPRGPAFVDVNPAALALLGPQDERLAGRALRDVLGDGAAAMDDAVAAALRDGAAPVRFPMQGTYGGKPRELDAVAVLLPGGARETLVLVTARDMTHQHALEAALRQSQKMEAVGQLTGGIAHDFNNLLTGIGGSIELLRTRAVQGRTAELERHAEAGLAAVQRAAALTHRLLAFARRQALDPRPADLNRLIAGMDDLVRRTVGPEILVDTRLAPGLWPCLCDANQLESALLNLCINARDAMPGGGHLSVATANLPLVAEDASELDCPPGDYATVTVHDSGTGMPAEVVARAFEPFFTTKPIGQGTGLGLSMLYGFVRQSGGYVRIDSAPGHGTAVRIGLPRSQATMEVVPARAAQQAPPVRDFAGRTVLVVEDEAVVRALAIDVLHTLSCTVLQAREAQEALRLLHTAGPIDLLLTDIGLPGMNGRALAQAARALRPKLLVLFMTGYAFDPDGPHVMLEPRTGTLNKPFRLEALEAKLRAMLSETVALA